MHPTNKAHPTPLLRAIGPPKIAENLILQLWFNIQPKNSKKNKNPNTYMATICIL